MQVTFNPSITNRQNQFKKQTPAFGSAESWILPPLDKISYKELYKIETATNIDIESVKARFIEASKKNHPFVGVFRDLLESMGEKIPKLN